MAILLSIMSHAWDRNYLEHFMYTEIGDSINYRSKPKRNGSDS